MKLRFGIETASRERIRQTLDAMCVEPPIGRRLSYVYLDTPQQELARRGIALRFRRSAAVGASSPRRPWLRQEIWPKGEACGSLKKLGIKRLKQRLDAAFSVRIERWTWTIDDGWATISLDHAEVSTGIRQDRYDELRLVCRRKHADAATRLAVELGATQLASRRARERGHALLGMTETC